MDPQLKALLDKYHAAGATDDEMRQVASDWQAQNGSGGGGGGGGGAATTPAPGTDVSPRNLLRSFMQGATLNMGDSPKVPSAMRIDAGAESAFNKAHPWLDAAARAAGGVIAPAAAIAAAPEALAGLGGAALVGGLTGAVSGAGAGVGVSPMDRLENAGQGGAAGMAGGAAGYGIGKAVSGAAGAMLDRLNPSRAVARAAAQVTSPADVAALQDMNASAPGTASPATTVVPRDARGIPEYNGKSRFLSMFRGIGANPAAAREAESSLLGQRVAIGSEKNAIGAQMDALDGHISVTPTMKKALDATRKVLGPTNTPEPPNVNPYVLHPGTTPAPSAVPPGNSVAPLGIEHAPDLSMEPETPMVKLQDMRDALSRLRLEARSAEGVRLHDVNTARKALQDELYAAEPKFAALDKQYAKLLDQDEHVSDLLSTVRTSRQNHAASTVASGDVSSVGGSLMKGKLGVAKAVAQSATGNDTHSLMSPRAAAAMGKYLLKPGGPELLDQLMKNLPSGPGMGRGIPAAAGASTANAARGLLQY